MKFKQEFKISPFQKTWFAFLPITINGETRWLEKVTVECHHIIISGIIRTINDKFIN